MYLHNQAAPGNLFGIAIYIPILNYTLMAKDIGTSIRIGGIPPLAERRLRTLNDKSPHISANIYSIHAYFGLYWGHNRLMWIYRGIIFPETNM